MNRHFNTAGPNLLDDHYTIDPFTRLNWSELEQLIDGKKYFILHAPRQSGKTTLLRAIVEKLNQEGRHEVLKVNVENAQAVGHSVAAGIPSIVELIGNEASLEFPEGWLANNWRVFRESTTPHNALMLLLQQWTVHANHPTVLLIDEIDSLVGDTLVSVLRQLRSGYEKRPKQYPQSIILCGVRDVRDYDIHTSSNGIVRGGSCFNIKSESIRLGNFSEDEVRTLYRQHTTETGQSFEDPVHPAVMRMTRGQPWLVNALAHELTAKSPDLRDRTRSITLTDLDNAKERLILRRDTHLDQLVDKLREDRVRRVIEPILIGGNLPNAIPHDDVQYVVDLGLVSLTEGGAVDIANSIYREVIPRALTWIAQINLKKRFSDTAFHHPNGSLNFRTMLKAFQQFFRENSDAERAEAQYTHATPQLLLQAWLQRVVNSCGTIEREFALGSKRADIFVRHYHSENGKHAEQRFVVEVKMVHDHDSLETTIAEGLQQTAGYADRCDPEESHLMVVDTRENRTWEDRIFVEERTYDGRQITVWGM